MIYPIVAYGHPVLRTRAQEINPDHPGLPEIIANMYETMYNAKGVGLAAPQIGKSIRIFIVDGTPMEGMLEDDPTPMEGWKKVFINPTKINEHGEAWGYDEGCLSIPDIIEEVYREEHVHLRYFDENFVQHEATFGGLQSKGDSTRVRPLGRCTFHRLLTWPEEAIGEVKTAQNRPWEVYNLLSDDL
ncbi:MAG: hypothetical protein RLZZ519_3483 [Bacteroidota bacterium]|jgi:peptide deformylase